MTKKEKKREYDKKRYKENVEKKKQYAKDNYAKNPAKKHDYYLKNIIKITEQRKRKKNKKKKKEYDRIYYRFKKDTRKDFKKQLLNRRINPTTEQINWMKEVCDNYFWKFKSSHRESDPGSLYAVGYDGLVIAIRTQKYEEWFDIEKHIKRIVWYSLLNEFKKNKNRIANVSLSQPLTEYFELIETIESKSLSENIETKDEADYYMKILKKGFKEFSKKFDLYEIWYEQNVLKMTEKEMAEKYKIGVKTMESRILKAKQIFRHLQKKIIDPSYTKSIKKRKNKENTTKSEDSKPLK